MNIDWLRYYLALADTLNYHRAAERLHVTPQAVSHAITALESSLRLTLVQRRQKRVVGLTPAGVAFAEEARAIVQRIDQAHRRMDDWLTGTPQGPVRLASSSLWLNDVLPGPLAEVVRTWPEITPELSVLTSDETENRLLSSEVDLGLLTRPPRSPELASLPLWTSDIVIVGRPAPVAGWQDLAYIVPGTLGPAPTPSPDGWPEDRHPRRIAARTELLETAIRLCEQGVGAAYVPQITVQSQLAAGRLAVLAEPPARQQVTLHLVWQRNGWPSPAVRAVLGQWGVSLDGAADSAGCTRPAANAERAP